MQSDFLNRKRLQRELQAMEAEENQNEDSDVFAKIVDEDLRHWIGRIKGPKDTPFEKGIFFIDIKIPERYPYQPPDMRFETKVWHPNISSQTGVICLDILKNEWSPALTIRTTLLSIKVLLSTPVPEDPQDAQVAEMYLRNFDEYEKKAREWVQIYASITDWPCCNKLNSLLEMGINKEEALDALKKHNWDLNLAANDCFGKL